MKKIFTGLALGVMTVAGSIFADTQLTRTDEANLLRPSSERRSVPMPRGLEKRVHTENTLSNGLKTFSSTATAVPRHQTNKSIAPKATMKVAAKATNIEGTCIYREGAADVGWFKVTWPTDQLLWKRPADYSPVCGFVRGSELYAFYSLARQGEGIVDAGIAIHDVSTGTVLEYIQNENIFDTFEQIPLVAAYNEADDEALVITYNKAGNGYLLQKFNPVTKDFTNLGVTPPTNFLDFGYNPAEGAYFLLDDAGKMMRYDSKAKKFNTVCTYSYDMTDYPNDMVYSPKDGAFFALLDSYDDQDYPCTDAVLLTLDGKVSYLGTISDNPQYSILHIGDIYVNSNAAKAPTFKSWNVDGAATTGSLTLTLPSTFENGKALSGNVYLSAQIDGTDISGTFKGAPGADVTIPVNTDEGLHFFKITPYTLTDDGRLNGTSLNIQRYFGLDTPAKPTNVVLTENKVTWDAVTAGANDGYIVPADVRYIVSIDGVQMNEEPVAATELSVTIPATGTVAHKASVVATAGGKNSEPGLSGRFYVDGTLSLPVTITPEEGETNLDEELINMFTIVNNPLNQDLSKLRGWRYDDQSEKTGGFYCLCPTTSPNGETGDEWLFLPAINFPDKDAHYRFCVDLWSGNHYFTSDEYYEIGIAKRPSGNNATIIREEDIVYKGRYFELSETLFQVPEAGDYYIGIHYISPLDSYRLYARNFRVEKAEASADSPATVTDLSAKAAERGGLEATLSFKIPTLSISGDNLDPATVISVTATSKAGEATVTGKPGEAVTLTVPTIQGDNIITVTPSSEKGYGLSSEVLVYTGVYLPGKAIIDYTISDDDQTMTLNIDLDDYNENDEFVGPDDCDITIYRRIGSDWRVAAEIGKNRTWTFQCPEPNTQDMYQFGVAAKNAVGYCEEMTTFGMHLGKVYNLPLNETFPTSGENVNFFEPISLENISYLGGDWGFCDPEDVDEAAANGGSTALYATWECTTQALLPKFATTGMHNVKLDLNLFFGNKSPKMITVFATSPAITMEPIASFTRTDGNGWEHKLISLPAACQDKGWVQIIIRVELEGYQQFFLLDSYSVADYPEDMMTISSLKGNSRAALGDTLIYTAEIENAGTKTAPLPDYTFQILSDAGIAADLKAKDAPESIEPKQKATLTFEYTPKAADKGELLARLSISGQPTQAISEAEVNTTLINALVPIVNDLTGNVTEDEHVLLSWSKPRYTESFEAFEPWDYSETMRGFRNLDIDGAKVWSIQELSYPGKGFAKAFQVFTGKSVDNPLLQANSGEYYLGCMSASKGTSDDWLISPEVKGGSEFSFYMNICDGNYPETILVAYSTTGNNPEDFRNLPGGYICPDDRGWAKYSFTLPADAKYFALHHVADNGDEQFGLMIDDIAFEPIEGAPVVESYNLYRDQQLIASGLTSESYLDNDADLSSPTMYTVKSVSTVNGEKIESDRSNVVWTESSRVNAIAAANGISAGKNRIFLSGFDKGTRYSIANTSGVVIFSGEISAERTAIPVAPGVYVVNCGKTKAKVIVR